MGNTESCIVKNNAILNEFQGTVANQSLEKISGAYAQFLKLNRFSTACSAAELASILSLHEHVCAMQFDILCQTSVAHDEDDTQKVNLLEYLGPMIVCSKATINQKIKFAFNLYDANRNLSLSLAELTIMLHSIIRGLCKMTASPIPCSSKMAAIAKAAFAGADQVKDQKITYIEFCSWVRKTPAAVSMLRNFVQTSSTTTTTSDKLWTSKHNDSLESLASKCGKSVNKDKAAGDIQRIFRGRKVRQQRRQVRKSGISRRVSSQASVTKRFRKVDVLRIRARFRNMDVDCSGAVDVKEFLESNGLDSVTEAIDMKHAYDMFRSIDKDHSGGISLTELLRVVFPNGTSADYGLMGSWIAQEDAAQARRIRQASRPQITNEQKVEMRSIFDLYDRDGDGNINLPELKNALKSSAAFTSSDVERMFEECDVNNNGELSWNEFRSFFQEYLAY